MTCDELGENGKTLPGERNIAVLNQPSTWYCAKSMSGWCETVMAESFVLVAIVAVLQLSGSARALTEPDCPVMEGTPCVGHLIGNFAPGERVDEILAFLRDRFCGCTHVTGSIQINMFGNADYTNLTEDSFNFLYYVREISGVLRFQNIPPVSRIVLPNLRIIRGDDLIATSEGHGLALVLLETHIGALVMPNLTEVTRGNVRFENTSSMCNYKSINWTDIIDNGELEELLACNTTQPGGPLDCSSCDPPKCWSSDPLYCQTFTKQPCPPCGRNRCYRAHSGTVHCCNSHCAAGCEGPSADQCYACNDFRNNGTCVAQCPPAVIYNPDLFQIMPNPNYRLVAGHLCVEQCPEGFLELSGSCIPHCPESFFSNEGRCIMCDGPCPRECAGLQHSQIVDGTTIDQFSECNIITTGGMFIGPIANPNFDLTRLELLSTIQEIWGPVRIDGWTEETFPYLRNLRRIGHPNATTLTEFCGGEFEYSLVVARNSQLQELDLSSLESIRGGGVLVFNNPQLCFVGNLSTHLTNPSEQHQCIVRSRRDPQTCINESFVCHEQCDSTFSCWGANDTQCDSCRNFQYLQRCVQDCSVMSRPDSFSGLYQNPYSRVCEECDQQCVGGCTGGTGPMHCHSCRNYYTNEIEDSGATVRTCVEECLQGTCLVPSSRQCAPYACCNATLEYYDHHSHVCIPCASACQGCTGPAFTGCLQCAPGFVKKYNNDRSSFTCHDGCDLADYVSEEGVCEDCDALCQQCVGSGSRNCTMCRDTRFQAPIEVYGSGSDVGPELVECFPCVTSQQLVNRTCTDIEPPSVEVLNTGLLNTAEVVGIVVGGIVLLVMVGGIILIVGYLYYNSHFVHPNDIDSECPGFQNPMFGDVSDFKQLDLLVSHRPSPQLRRMLPHRMIIPSSVLKLNNSIGQGEFGVVYKACLQWHPDAMMEIVAVKTLKGLFTPNDVDNLVQEVLKMHTLSHPNVMPLTGVCLDTGGGPAVVMPFMGNGSVLHYLKKERGKLVPPDDADCSVISDVQTQLLGMCLQISKGMEYLAKERIVHRDLAARNCMMDASGAIKVADFGLSEDIYTSAYYRQKKTDTAVKLPVRWMAPESIADGIFTEKSDVWSFGVTCWEVFTGGQIPYSGVSPVALFQLLHDGERLNKPMNPACSDEIYAIILECWKKEPKERPDFSKLVVTISKTLENVAGYMKFSLSIKHEHPVADEVEVKTKTGVQLLSEKEDGGQEETAACVAHHNIQ